LDLWWDGSFESRENQGKKDIRTGQSGQLRPDIQDKDNWTIGH